MNKGIRHFLLTAAVLLASLSSLAQERMTFLDWHILAKDTLCPVYSEVVSLETDYRHNSYTISLEYPTWEPLNAEELALARRHAGKIGDSIRIEHYVSVSRGEGMLNYSFIPIVYRNGHYAKLSSAKITIIPTSLPSSARTTGRTDQRYAEHSVLASGTWKKIHITKDGIYRLTPAFLSKMGFSNPDNVRLYGYGGHQQAEALDADNDFDDLEEVPLYRTTDGNLLFWGNGLVRWEGTQRVFNAYATKATYFLTESNGPRPEIVAEAEFSGPVKQKIATTLGHALHEVDDYAWFRGGRNLVESTLFAGAYSRNYTLSGINSLGNERLTVVFTGNDVSTPLTIWANGGQVAVKTISAPGSYMYYSEGKFPNMNVSEYSTGTDTWKITLATQGPFATNDRVQGRLDYIALNYTAPLELQNGFVRFGEGVSGTRSGNNTSAAITTYSGATEFREIGKGSVADVRIMRLGSRNRPACIISHRQTEDGLAFSASDGTDTFVAFDPSHSFPEPTAGESVQNQDLHAMDSVDMVIIVPAGGKLTAQAERLAEAHRQYSGINCVVVRADHIYNEFSSGTPDATAYRRFMKMLYDRGISDGTAPRYLLLFGDCAWDNRMKSSAWRTYSPNDYLLCYQSENSYSDTHSYCWEDYFGMMDDGEGTAPTRDVSDLGIGRFPVTTESQARIMVDKTIAHLRRDNAGEWRNRIVIMGDDGDNNVHMKDANKVADKIMEASPDHELHKLMWDSYTRTNQGLYYSYPEVRSQIEQYMEEGAMLFNYTGHGATYLMSHERVITLDDIKSWKSDHLPLWFVAACDITPFDSQEANLGEAAVLNEDGVAVAFIGTTRTVYSTQNYYLNNFFSQYLFGHDKDGMRLSVGDALRKAKGSMVDSDVDGSQPQNKLQYALLGDPALIFGNPEAKVVLDSINGKPVSGEQQFQGGASVRLSGHIEREHGSIDEQFNGLVFFRLYDVKSTLTTRGNTGNEPFVYDVWNKELNNGSDSIVNGRFSTTIIIPKDISYSNESGRLVFYAVSSDNTIEANGSSEDFMVGGYSQEAAKDTIGPEIFMYLNDKDFMDGDAVNSTPVFAAELHDNSGIQYNGNGIGHDLQLCIDGDPRKTFNLNSCYTQLSGDYTRGNVYFAEIPELEEGAHWLSFRAWDMMNNTTQKTLKFVVGKDLEPELLSLMLESDVVSGHTNFHIGYNFPGLECDFTLEIYAVNGAVQWRQTVAASGSNGIVTIPWASCNGDGAPLRDGIYICRVTASHQGGKKSYKEKKFILRGNK